MKIIIPAFEPDQRMLGLIHEIKANSDYDILVINDGSSEQCQPLFEQAIEYGCTILTHNTNQGKGAALKTAFAYLQENHCEESFLCADCDGQHSWGDIQKLAQELPFHPTSIVLGSRKFVGKIPFRSRFGNTVTRIIFSMITGSNLLDTQTGLRGFHGIMLPWLVSLAGNRYEYEMNQLLEARKVGFDFYSIPINTIYENNNKGSHFHPFRDSVRVYFPILKFSMSSMFCGFLDFILLFVFQGLTSQLLFSVFMARMVSSMCNYFLNKQLVFAKEGNQRKTLLQYYLLVAVIMGCNYLLISFLHDTLGIQLFFSKLMTEAVLFILSYTVQHTLIFKKEK